MLRSKRRKEKEKKDVKYKQGINLLLNKLRDVTHHSLYLNSREMQDAITADDTDKNGQEEEKENDGLKRARADNKK